jgi:hypothetical protein
MIVPICVLVCNEMRFATRRVRMFAIAFLATRDVMLALYHHSLLGRPRSSAPLVETKCHNRFTGRLVKQWNCFFASRGIVRPKSSVEGGEERWFG